MKKSVLRLLGIILFFVETTSMQASERHPPVLPPASVVWYTDVEFPSKKFSEPLSTLTLDELRAKAEGHAASRMVCTRLQDRCEQIENLLLDLDTVQEKFVYQVMLKIGLTYLDILSHTEERTTLFTIKSDFMKAILGWFSLAEQRVKRSGYIHHLEDALYLGRAYAEWAKSSLYSLAGVRQRARSWFDSAITPQGSPTSWTITRIAALEAAIAFEKNTAAAGHAQIEAGNYQIYYYFVGRYLRRYSPGSTDDFEYWRPLLSAVLSSSFTTYPEDSKFPILWFLLTAEDFTYENMTKADMQRIRDELKKLSKPAGLPKTERKLVDMAFELANKKDLVMRDAWGREYRFHPGIAKMLDEARRGVDPETLTNLFARFGL